MIKVDAPAALVPVELTLALTPQAVQTVLGDIMDSARAFWIQRAGEKLHSSSRDYINGIQQVVLEKGSASITLVGGLPAMIEEGMPAFDMRDTLLGPNVPVVGPGGGKGKRQNKDGGFYRAIPFRHQVPGSSGKGGGTPMGAPYGPPGAALGRAIHKAAKQLGATTSMPGGGTKWGERLPAGVGGAGLLRPHHSTDIYAGMVRQEKTYAKATQNTFMTFRMISTSKPDGWMHPGIVAANITDEVIKHIQDLAPQAFLAALGMGSP